MAGLIQSQAIQQYVCGIHIYGEESNTEAHLSIDEYLNEVFNSDEGNLSDTGT